MNPCRTCAGRFECGGPCDKLLAVLGDGDAHAAVAALAALPEPSPDPTVEVTLVLTWILAALDASRDQGDTGLDPAPLSEEMRRAHRLLEELRAGKIKCRRLP